MVFGDYISATSVAQSPVTGDLGGDTLVFTGAYTEGSVYGGSLTDTSLDGADSIDFTTGAMSAFIQLNGGNDTLDFSADSSQSTVKGGQGNDSIIVGGGQLDVKANLGDDTLNITASTSSSFDAGAGSNYIRPFLLVLPTLFTVAPVLTLSR